MEDTPQGPNDSAPPPPPPADPAPAKETAPAEVVSDNRNIMIVLSYLGPLALIPLLVEKEDREIQWHAKHGLVLLATSFAAFIVLIILGIVGTMLPAGFGCIVSLLWFGLVIVWLVIAILCIVKGLNGERFLIPRISDFADRF